MKSRTLLYIILLIVILVVVKIFFFKKEIAPAGPGGKGAGNMPPMKVNGIVVQGFSLEEKVYATGTVLANEEVELRPEVSGKITKLNIREGSSVSKGELLIKINDTDLQAQLVKLENNKKIIADKADRQKKLFEMNGVSKEEYDDVLNQMATVDADIQFTKAQIAKTEIRAPFNGQIGLRNISEGSYVNQNFLIATIQQVNPVKIDFSLPEKYSSYLKSGKDITFTVEGNTQTFEGKVYAIEPKVDAATRTIKIRALSANVNGTILPGAFARVNMILNHSDNAITIPTEAIIPVLKGKKVFVCRNGIVVSQPVNNGMRNEKNIEILNGLNIGDTVITSGIMQLKDSMKVVVNVTPQIQRMEDKTKYMNIKHSN